MSNKFPIVSEIDDGGNTRMTVDETLSDKSSNPVANWVVKKAIEAGGGGGGGGGKGIDHITKTGTSGLVDTYTIYYTDGTTTTYNVTNGKDGADGKDGKDGKDGVNGKDGKDGVDGAKGDPGEKGDPGVKGDPGDDGDDGVGISNIAKTGTSGLTDTYTITYTDGTTSTFTVKNGEKGDKGDPGNDGAKGDPGDDGDDGVGISNIAKTGTSGLVDTYTIILTNGTTKTFTVTNGKDGEDGQDGTDGADAYIPTLAKLKTELLKTVYPVGAIYMSATNTNPSTFIGGTWVAWGSGRVPVGVNTSDTDFSTVEKTGGAKTHRHDFKIGMGMYYGAAIGDNWNSPKAGAYKYSTGAYAGNTNTTGRITAIRNSALSTNMITYSGTSGETVRESQGDTQTASSLQPYITCYMFKRTA